MLRRAQRRRNPLAVRMDCFASFALMKKLRRALRCAGQQFLKLIDIGIVNARVWVEHSRFRQCTAIAGFIDMMRFVGERRMVMREWPRGLIEIPDLAALDIGPVILARLRPEILEQ